MGKGNVMPNVAIVREFPIQTTTEPRDKGELSRLIKILIWTGTLMAQPDTPRGWGWNPSVITLCLVILSIVASAAYFIGHLTAEVEFIKQQQTHTEAVAQDALKVNTFATADGDKGDGHKVANTNTSGTAPR